MKTLSCWHWIPSCADWKLNLDKTRNISLRHTKIVKVAVSDIACNICFVELQYIKILWIWQKDYLTYEVRVVSIEGNDEAEKVADWHNQLKELIEGQNLQQIEAENIFVPFTINSSPASSNAPSFFFL